MMRRLLDNRFWYIGFTYTEFNGREFEKCPCVIICNPFGRWKSNHERKREEKIADAEYQKAYEKAYEEYRDAFNKRIDEISIKQSDK
jgi:hypothetical protein